MLGSKAQLDALPRGRPGSLGGHLGGMTLSVLNGHRLSTEFGRAFPAGAGGGGVPEPFVAKALELCSSLDGLEGWAHIPILPHSR